MSTTATASLKIGTVLKARIAKMARERGKTPHAFMLEALEAQTALEERRAAFFASALEAEREVDASGAVFDGAEVLAYVEAKLGGENPRRPKARRRVR